MNRSLVHLPSFVEEERPSKPHSDRVEPTAATLFGVSPQIKPLRMRTCRTHTRRRLAAAWPPILEALVTEAEKGSVSHTNLLVKLAGFDLRPEPQRKPKRREKSFAKQLLEEMDELEARNIAEYGPL